MSAGEKAEGLGIGAAWGTCWWEFYWIQFSDEGGNKVIN
jgi:hypothetical protein